MGRVERTFRLCYLEWLSRVRLNCRRSNWRILCHWDRWAFHSNRWDWCETAANDVKGSQISKVISCWFPWLSTHIDFQHTLYHINIRCREGFLLVFAVIVLMGVKVVVEQPFHCFSHHLWVIFMFIVVSLAVASPLSIIAVTAFIFRLITFYAILRCLCHCMTRIYLWFSVSPLICWLAHMTMQFISLQ